MPPITRAVALKGFRGLYVDRIMTVLLGDILWAVESYFKTVYLIVKSFVILVFVFGNKCTIDHK